MARNSTEDMRVNADFLDLLNSYFASASLAKEADLIFNFFKYSIRFFQFVKILLYEWRKN